MDKVINLSANEELRYLCKRLIQMYVQFLINFYELQDDPTQQQILELARTSRNKYININQIDSIKQAFKLGKDLFMVGHIAKSKLRRKR